MITIAPTSKTPTKVTPVGPHHAKNPPPPPYDLVADDATLAAVCARMEAAEVLALDTEFVGENTFYPALELVQLFDGHGTVALIDAQAIGDWKPLARLLAREKTLKLLHSGSQDLSLLARVTGEAPRPLFDTQLAAAMAGLGEQISYANLVREFVGVALEKGETVSNWSQRPLREAQLDYAALDVLHLHQVHRALHQRLVELERLEWFEEEQQARAALATRDEEDVDEDELYRNVKEWSKVPESKLIILQELARWRETTARATNVPRRQLMPDAALVGLARLAPAKGDDLRNQRQLPMGPVMRHRDELIEVVQRARAIPKDQWPRKRDSLRPDLPSGVVEILQAFVRAVAEEQSIAPSLLVTTSDLQTLVTLRHKLESVDLPVLRGWRREMIGEKLIGVLDGRVSVRIDGRDRLVFEAIQPAARPASARR